MELAGFLRVVLGLNLVAMRHVGVMTGLVVVARFVMLGCRLVVQGGVFVVFSGFEVMLRGFFRHGLVEPPRYDTQRMLTGE